jgi:hypothetical protein
MDEKKVIDGYYGSQNTPCKILVCADYPGAWYVVVGGSVANYTPDADVLVDGVNVNDIDNSDSFIWSGSINNLDDFEYIIINNYNNV